MKPNWTVELCMKSAAMYQTKKEWISGGKGSYNAAQRLGVIEQCASHMVAGKRKNGSWALETCKSSAAIYSTRKQWIAGDKSAHSAAQRLGILDICCEHMEAIPRTKYWTLEKCMKSAANYQGRGDWQAGEPGARTSSHVNGWDDKCCGHMGTPCGSDNDAVYIWEAVGEIFNGNPVYKIGVTSARLGDRRIKGCAQKARLHPRIVILAETTEKATDIEALLLSLGSDPKYVDIEGKTEYRSLNNDELTEAVELISSVAV